jgi:hypothetical protein
LLVIPVIDVSSVFSGFEAIIAQEANIPIDLARHLRV